jgi:hypothetical protein
MEREFNYVYAVTNLINGKKYIGDHSTNNLDDGYLGSGQLLKMKITQYGKENFKKEILEFFPKKKDAFEAQEKYINEHHSLIPNGYNISPKGGYGVPDSYLNEKTKEKISNSNLGKCCNLGNKFALGHNHTEETKNFIRSIHKGKPKTEEHKKNLQISNKGKKHKPFKKHPLSDESRKNISQSLLNRSLSQDHRKNISKGLEGREFHEILKTCEHCGKKVGHLNYGRWHGDRCRYIMSIDSSSRLALS